MVSRPPWLVSLLGLTYLPICCLPICLVGRQRHKLFLAYLPVCCLPICLVGRQRHKPRDQSFRSGQVPPVEHRKQKEREFDSMGTGHVHKGAHRQLYRGFY